MRYLTAAMVACLTLVGAAAMAQDGDLPTQQGDKAIYFSIGGLGAFNVGNAPVGTALGTTGIEGKIFTRDNFAWRLGLSLARASTTAANGTETVNTAFGIAPGIEYHFASQERFTLYTGGVLSYEWAEVETKPVGAASTSVDNNSFGLAALLGAEFYPWQNVSLSTEYLLGFMTLDKPDTTMWGLNSTGTVKLGFHF